MVNPGKRMHILKALLELRHGPGAAILPPEITRIHLDFALRWNDGHMGPRKFWKTCLPRLKFWNPAVPMLVNRSTNQTGPALMSIYFRQSAAKATKNLTPLVQQPHSSTTNECPAPPPEEEERVVTIDMKHQHSDAILTEFLQKTGATLVHPTPDEQMEMQQVEELQEKGAVDRAIVKKYLDEKRREEKLLLQARQEAEAIKLANQ
ncbi:CI-B8 domain-containing protein [Pseudomassariella vexata]|uniref:CI-B8 domain-domain-containing protein n=1 Tax=Pseudomassariella vexata TaxID=1141098 RepID=A0A1Y2DXM0_9PEZI|nr:CI-B8 domain-containing protein [Pseudomassariella vexata]ORY63993.1 CI-B8 domain-domain-containing protein [Pseudomassariella vexata]